MSSAEMKYSGSFSRRALPVRHRARIHELAIGEQLEGEYVDLLLRFLALANDVAEVMVRKGRLDAVRGVVRERERDRSRRRDGSVMREARTHLGELVHELRRDLGDALHVAAVARVQHPPRNLDAHPPAVPHHLGTLAQHLARDREVLAHDRRGPLLASEVEPRFPAGHRHLARHHLGELDGFLRAVFHAQQGDGRAQPEKAHAVPALARDLVSLLLERQPVDLDHVVEHAREHLARLCGRSPNRSAHSP